MQPSKIAYSCPKLFVAVFKAETNWIYSSMIIVNGILYLSSAWYSIFSFIQFFIIKIFPYWFLTKSIEIIENMIFSLLLVLQKIWYFRQLRKIKKIYLRWAFLQKYCFSCSVTQWQQLSFSSTTVISGLTSSVSLRYVRSICTFLSGRLFFSSLPILLTKLLCRSCMILLFITQAERIWWSSSIFNRHLWQCFSSTSVQPLLLFTWLVGLMIGPAHIRLYFRPPMLYPTITNL